MLFLKLQKTIMKLIVLAGGSGFLGRELASHFAVRGYQVAILTRSPGRSKSEQSEAKWDGCNLGAWQRELNGALAVINLTGKSVNCRYNAASRKEILESRVNSTRIIGHAIGQCAEPPRVWLN